MAACEHFEWCVKRAMEYSRKEDYRTATASFMSDAGKSRCTAHIANPLMMSLMSTAEVTSSPDAFERFIRGFKCSGHCKNE